MSDNIVGKDHLDYVKSQINTRQEILAKTTRDSEDIAWMSGKSSWIRLISSVDIEDENVVKYNKEADEDQLVSNNGAEFRNQFLGVEGYGGPQLAQENILQAGTLNYDALRFGVADSLDINPNTTSNYGFATDSGQRGLQPIPGITGFTSKTYNKGSLRKAQLQITAHNSQQFKYIDSLYLRLGYTMLLEWGNTSYPITEEDGSTRYATKSDIASLSLRDEFLYSYDRGSSYFYTRIEELRQQSQGNYDGFLGIVENFTWEFSKDGSYLITLDLITIGSVVESLKLNTNVDSIQYIDASSLLNSIDQNRPSALETAIDILTNSVIEIQKENKVTNVKVGSFASDGGTRSVITSKYKFPHTKSFLTSEEQKSLGVSNSITGDEATAMSCNVAYGEDNLNYKFYLRLGTLLEFINEKLLIYNSVGSPSLISIDTDENQFCYSNKYSFSGNPEKMINRLDGIQIDGIDIKVFDSLPKFHDILEDGSQVGRIMNLYFERDFLKSLIKEKTDKDGNLSLYEFLKELTNTVNPLLGGVNKLNIRLTEKRTEFNDGTYNLKEVLQIYDEVPFKKIDTQPIFNIFGFSENLKEGSFITDFNLKTEISKNLSTQIAIGAQANARSVGEDSTVFSKWNVGVVDRVIPTKLDIDKATQDNVQLRVDFSKLLATYKNYLLKLRRAGDNQNITSTEDTPVLAADVVTDFTGYVIPDLYLSSTKDEVPSFLKFQEIQKDFFTKALSYDAERKGITTPFIGFIPINLSLTMDGLSGVRIFDKLTIDSRFLPQNYTNTLDFIITELDHKFEQNKWVTTVGTLSKPKLFDEKPELPLEVLSDDRIAREDPNSIDIPNYFYSDHPRVLGWKRIGPIPPARRVTKEEILKVLNLSVRGRFDKFLTSLIQDFNGGQGYEIRITSSYRDFTNSYNEYRYNNGVERTPQAILEKTIKSPHFWGLALDINIFEAVEKGGSSKKVAGFGYDSLDTWRNLGIVNIAKLDGVNLRWGGTFNGYPDGVHFDAVTNSWAGENGQAAKIADLFLKTYKSLPVYYNQFFNPNMKSAVDPNILNPTEMLTISRLGDSISYNSDWAIYERNKKEFLRVIGYKKQVGNF